MEVQQQICELSITRFGFCICLRVVVSIFQEFPTRPLQTLYGHDAEVNHMQYLPDCIGYVSLIAGTMCGYLL